MKTIWKIFAPIYGGLATGYFYQGKFEKAIRLFKKAISLNPNEKRMEYYFSLLGQSYQCLNKNDDADDALSEAYKLFHITGEFENDKVMEQYVELLNSYKVVLEKVGKKEEASEISNELSILSNRNDWEIMYKKEMT